MNTMKLLNVLGYCYSASVLILAVALTFLFHTGHLDSMLAQPQTNTSRETASTNANHESHKEQTVSAGNLTGMQKPKMLSSSRN
jgi:hypothetical protein